MDELRDADGIQLRRHGFRQWELVARERDSSGRLCEEEGNDVVEVRRCNEAVFRRIVCERGEVSPDAIAKHGLRGV